MKFQFKVSTQDVDGSDSKKYKTLEGAKQRFESMVGYSLENAIREFCYEREERGEPMPVFPDQITFVRAVSNFGTVVRIEAKEVA